MRLSVHRLDGGPDFTGGVRLSLSPYLLIRRTKCQWMKDRICDKRHVRSKLPSDIVSYSRTCLNLRQQVQYRID